MKFCYKKRFIELKKASVIVIALIAKIPVTTTLPKMDKPRKTFEFSESISLEKTNELEELIFN